MRRTAAQGGNEKERTIWPDLIPGEQWLVYQAVINAAQTRGFNFALGGAFALATYTGQWRNSKDMDIYILSKDREGMIEVLRGAGLKDYYDELPYDRSWIYRASREGIIVDIIWAMANHRAQVDESWLARGPEVNIRGETLKVVPPEEMLWHKLYVLQRDRCDWPDVLNLIYAIGANLDWNYLLDRVADDALLLNGVLSVFSWICPSRARALPEWLWARLNMPVPELGDLPETDLKRINLLDTRPWFSSGQQNNQFSS